MENPFSHNRATNVIGKLLDKVKEEAEKVESELEISMASVEYRIMMALWEADCLTDRALEIIGLAGRHGYPDQHFCHDQNCPDRHHQHDCHDEHCHHHHRPSV